MYNFKRGLNHTEIRTLLNPECFRTKAQEALLEKYDPVQVGYMSEKCIAVDEDDNILGGVSKAEAHHVDTREFIIGVS